MILRVGTTVQKMKEEEIEATRIVHKNQEYYYVINDSVLYGIIVYVFDKMLSKYVRVTDDELIKKYLKLYLKNKDYSTFFLGYGSYRNEVHNEN
jgi:hypothetical protein